METKSPKISVIVPVYNVKKYLSRCIDSILAQTFTDFELLLIDDGSKDNSGKICDEYAKKDNRIRVFHKENGGVSSARNVGLDNAGGEWITFVDSDDCLNMEFLSELIKYDNYDHIIGGNIMFSERNINRGINKEVIIDLKSIEAARLDFGTDINSSIFFCYPWGKLYKTAIIESNNIRFNIQMFLGEDLCFVLEYLSFCDNAIVVPYNNYLYRYENQQNKFPMNYQQFSIHCIAFMNSMHRFEVHTGCKFPKIYSSIIRSFFYHYYTYLKKCKTYRFYVEQSRLIKQFDIDKIRYALREESFLKRCYLYIMIGIPCIGYFVNRFK